MNCSAKRRCLFLDRDGVVNIAPEPGVYIRHWSEFHFQPGIADWIRLFKAAGFLVIVVTNQRGVARGLVRPEDLEEIHHRMAEELDRRGAAIDDILCCPHEEGECDCRKPRPGLVAEAERRWSIDLRSSLIIGDSERDRELAANCGMTFVLARAGHVVDVIEPNEAADL